MRKILSLLLVAILVISVFAGCSRESTQPDDNDSSTSSNSSTQQDSTEDQSSDAEGKYDKEITVTVARRGDTRSVDEDLFSPVLKEKFNLVLDVMDINNSDFVTKMNLLFASGEAPDVNTAQRPDFMLNEWIQAGYLIGYTKDEVKEKLPNYYNHYTEAEWETVWKAIRHSDDKAYYLPSRRPTKINMAWVYRADTFERLGLEFPESTDELIEVMRTIKKETGRFPYVGANPSVLWAFTGFMQAFGMPELAPRDLSYVDPVSGEFIPYAFVTDNFREHVKYMNQLYEEGLIWPEFATGTSDQVNSMLAQGHGYIQWGYPEKIDTEYNRLSRNADPEAEWDWAKVMLSNDPEKGVFFKVNPYFNADGVAFSSDADDEVIERYMDYMDWLHTEEGMVFTTYGIEGITYEKEGENYVFKEHMSSPVKPEGKTLTNYGFLSGVQHPNLNEYYKPYLIELENTFLGREGYYYHISPVLNFTDEENSELADITTSLNQTAEEYYAKFIMGQIDIENDQEWNNYIQAMEKLGLERFEEIRTTAYERSNN